MPLTRAAEDFGGFVCRAVDDLLQGHIEGQEVGHRDRHGGVGQHAAVLVEVGADGVGVETLLHGRGGDAGVFNQALLDSRIFAQCVYAGLCAAAVFAVEISSTVSDSLNSKI